MSCTVVTAQYLPLNTMFPHTVSNAITPNPHSVCTEWFVCGVKSLVVRACVYSIRVVVPCCLCTVLFRSGVWIIFRCFVFNGYGGSFFVMYLGFCPCWSLRDIKQTTHSLNATEQNPHANRSKTVHKQQSTITRKLETKVRPPQNNYNRQRSSHTKMIHRNLETRLWKQNSVLRWLIPLCFIQFYAFGNTALHNIYIYTFPDYLFRLTFKPSSDLSFN